MSAQYARDLWFITARLSIRQSNREQRNAPSVIEHQMACGFSPPRHVHREEDETFYILEGSFRFDMDGSTRELKPGDTIFIPRGVIHGFKVESPEGGRCLSITNGGFESMVIAASRPASADGLPEQLQPTPEMQARLAEIASANGIDLVGPPPVMSGSDACGTRPEPGRPRHSNGDPKAILSWLSSETETLVMLYGAAGAQPHHV